MAAQDILGAAMIFIAVLCCGYLLIGGGRYS
jgi:hypothetical protein